MPTMLEMKRFAVTAAIAAALAIALTFGTSAKVHAAEVIRIGALNPLTGSGSVYGPGMLEAIRIAVEQVNEAGGPLGRKLELHNADDQSDPNAAVLAAEKLVNLDKVRAIFGTYASAVTLAVQPIAIRNDVIIMNTSGAPQVSEKGPLSVTIRVDYQEKQTRYRAELNKVLGTQPDMVLAKDASQYLVAQIRFACALGGNKGASG